MTTLFPSARACGYCNGITLLFAARGHIVKGGILGRAFVVKWPCQAFLFAQRQSYKHARTSQ